MRWCCAGVVPVLCWCCAGVVSVLRWLLPAVVMLSMRLSLLQSKLNTGVYETSAPTDRRVNNAHIARYLLLTHKLVKSSTSSFQTYVSIVKLLYLQLGGLGEEHTRVCY